MKNDIIKKIEWIEMESRKINKHYGLINAKYKLTSVEMKIVLTILSLVNKNDEDFFTYQIKLNTFNFLTDNNNHEKLKKSCKNLMSKPLEIKVNTNEWILFNWFSKIHYKGKESIIECKIEPDLKPYLLELKENFKTYDIKYILSMKSEYSIRIYELLKQYEKIGKRTFILDDLYETLNVPNSYKNFKDFRVRVLEQAGREIAELTDIYFDFKTIKNGRKIEKIEFKINKNKHNIKDDEKIFMEWVNHMRNNNTNKKVVYYENEKANVRINEKGMLYLDNGKRIEKDKAKIFWKWAYQNQDKLKCK